MNLSPAAPVSAAALAVAALLATPTTPAAAQPSFERVITGLSNPLFVTNAPGRADELFVVEKGGTVRSFDLSTMTLGAGPFLSIPDTDTASEGGLLGLAFHPDFATNGRLYVNVTVDNGGVNVGGATSPFSTRIREYTVSNPLTDTAVGSGPTEILSFAQPQANHNGGWIGFKPGDTGANLYIASGDGGASNDAGNGHTPGIGNAQDLTDNLLGKILRINVDGDDFAADPNRNYAIPTTNPYAPGGSSGLTGDDEIFAYGLRNPFRASFDRLTGDLYLGDVGQGAREEIDLILTDSTGGENFGWRLREGDVQTPGVGGPTPADYVAPIYDYTRGTGDFEGRSVTGGVLYRGPVAELQGMYVFGDFVNARIWAFDPRRPGWHHRPPRRRLHRRRRQHQQHRRLRRRRAGQPLRRRSGRRSLPPGPRTRRGGPPAGGPGAGGAAAGAGLKLNHV